MIRLLDRKTIEAMVTTAVDILADAGVAFESEDARNLFKLHGAGIDGNRVRIPAGLLEKALDELPPKTREPSRGKRLMAASPFGGAPMICDDESRGIRPGTVRDAVKLYKLAETSDLYSSVSCGVADPRENDSEDPFLGQIALLLKYSDKWPSLGLRATRSNTRDGDAKTSAGQSIRLIKEIRGADTKPVMDQCITPMAPLCFDAECLMTLEILVAEAQEVSLSPCTLSFMTGPETLMGIVIHDLAMVLAGTVYARLLEPGFPLGVSSFSTMTDMRTLQPAYGSPEYLHTQAMFYEACRHLGLEVSFSGGFTDSTRADFQAGFESCLTGLAPFSMTDVAEVWYTPGLMASFAGGSFKKMILDEELIINGNRILQGIPLSLDPLLKDKLKKSLETRSFLTIGSADLYRKENRLTRIFDKRGIDQAACAADSPVHTHTAKEIEKRLEAYVPPERSSSQKKLLNRYLPSRYKY